MLPLLICPKPPKFKAFMLDLEMTKLSFLSHGFSLRYAYCSCELTESTKWFGDVSEVHALRRHRRSSFSSYSRFLLSTRLLSLNVCHGIPLQNVVRFTLRIGNHHPSRRPSMMSIDNGLCNIVWTVEADVAAGQLLYITGDHVVMGCWEPEMAILMSSVEQAN